MERRAKWATIIGQCLWNRVAHTFQRDMPPHRAVVLMRKLLSLSPSSCAKLLRSTFCSSMFFSSAYDAIVDVGG